MSRTARHPTTSKKVLGGSILLLALVAFVPASWLGGINKPVGSVLQRFLTPISHPAAMISHWILRAEKAEPDDAVQAERDRYETLTRRLQEENRELRELIQELQGGIALTRQPMVPLTAPVVGYSGDLTNPVLRVRAGLNLGVDVNTVAAVRGVHLLGRVTDVSRGSSMVRPITSKSGGPIGAALFEDGEPTRLSCLLTPVGDGTLRGPVTAEFEGPDQQQRKVAVGSIARLDDDSWASNAQMLIVGTVINVRPDENQPLRQVVTVKPVADLRRASEMILRLTPPQQEGSR